MSQTRGHRRPAQTHDATIRRWAGRRHALHPISFDEAYGEVLLGFAQGRCARGSPMAGRP
jgi:hypothetical protein